MGEQAETAPPVYLLKEELMDSELKPLLNAISKQLVVIAALLGFLTGVAIFIAAKL